MKDENIKKAEECWTRNNGNCAAMWKNHKDNSSSPCHYCHKFSKYNNIKFERRAPNLEKEARKCWNQNHGNCGIFRIGIPKELPPNCKCCPGLNR